VIKEVVDTIPKDKKAAMLHFSQIYPLSERTGLIISGS